MSNQTVGRRLLTLILHGNTESQFIQAMFFRSGDMPTFVRNKIG